MFNCFFPDEYLDSTYVINFDDLYAQLSGTFINNLPHGVLIYISKSGSVLRTQWENGVRVQ